MGHDPPNESRPTDQETLSYIRQTRAYCLSCFPTLSQEKWGGGRGCLVFLDSTDCPLPCLRRAFSAVINEPRDNGEQPWCEGTRGRFYCSKLFCTATLCLRPEYFAQLGENTKASGVGTGRKCLLGALSGLLPPCGWAKWAAAQSRPPCPEEAGVQELFLCLSECLSCSWQFVPGQVGIPVAAALQVLS